VISDGLVTRSVERVFALTYWLEPFLCTPSDDMPALVAKLLGQQVTGAQWCMSAYLRPGSELPASQAAEGSATVRFRVSCKAKVVLKDGYDHRDGP